MKNAKIKNASKNIQKNIESKSILYIMDIDPSSKEGKSFRRKRRNELEKFAIGILEEDHKMRSKEDIQSLIKSFKSHFKGFYLSKKLSNYQDLYHGSNQDKIARYSKMIEIINKSK